MPKPVRGHERDIPVQTGVDKLARQHSSQKGNIYKATMLESQFLKTFHLPILSDCVTAARPVLLTDTTVQGQLLGTSTGKHLV